MKKSSMVALALIGASASSLSAAPEPHRYDIQVRLLEAGKLVAAPRLITDAGQLATFVADDGTKGWSLKVTATPDPANDTVTLASDIEFWSRPESRRRATTTIRMKEGDPTAFELAPQGSMPAMRVEISLHSL